MALEFDNHALSANGFGVAFGDKIILAELDFVMPAHGVTVLMGPSGTGKSTLLRSLAWQNQPHPRFRMWGRLELHEQLLSENNHGTLVAQNFAMLNSRVIDFLSDQLRQVHSSPRSPADLLTEITSTLQAWNAHDILAHLEERTINLSREEQRRIAIIGAVLTHPKLLLLDEPTSELGESDAHMILDLIAEIGRHLPILVALHNQEQAKMIGDDIMLLAGGRIQASGTALEFFQKPRNNVVEHFIKTGSCFVPSPDAQPEDLSEDTPPPPPLPLTALLAKESTSEYRGPRGFRWIVPGKVATTPLPGAVIDINHDLAALRVVGVTMLITLTRNDLPQEALHKHGLRNLHLSIYDREPPTIAQLKMLTRRMSDMIQKGEVLAVHCRAGIGRTGTVIAGWLIKEGLTAEAALQRIRVIDKQYVQTAEQEQFLHDFEAHLLSSV